MKKAPGEADFGSSFLATGSSFLAIESSVFAGISIFLRDSSFSWDFGTSAPLALTSAVSDTRKRLDESGVARLMGTKAEVDWTATNRQRTENFMAEKDTKSDQGE